MRSESHLVHKLRTVGAAAAAAASSVGVPSTLQFVFLTATLPEAVINRVKREFPTVQVVTGPGLHRAALTVQQRLVDVSADDDNIMKMATTAVEHQKMKALFQSLRLSKCQRTLVFCNTVDSCRQVENALKRNDRRGQVYQVLSYHNAMTSTARLSNLKTFIRASTTTSTQPKTQRKIAATRTAVPKDTILVCTDRASRGIDFGNKPVDHVVVFDVPNSASEYVRRVGRTARAGRAGTCTILAYGWQLPLAREYISTTIGTASTNKRLVISERRTRSK